MSRDIRFRVWNKATETMHYPDWDELAVRARLVEMELMQFTGLKDKNEVEIYEGDVVKCNKPYDKAVITWQENESKFYGKRYGKRMATYAENLSMSWIQRYAEVIGNIYENPELVEVANDNGTV